MASTSLFLLLAAAGVLLLSAIWHGWSAGLPRILIELAGLVAAGLAAWTLYPVAASWIQPILPLPPPVVAVLAGGIIWIVVLVVCKIVAMIFVKRTKHYANPLKLIFGVGGAFLGLLEGLFILLVCAIGLRVAGTLAEGLKSQPGEPGSKPPYLVAKIAEINKAMEQSWVGAIVAALDPIPREFYADLNRLSVVVQNRDAMERFLSMPETRDLLAHPRLEPILGDPKVGEALRQRRFDEVAKNPNVKAAINDPDLWKKIRAFPWSKALRYAVPQEAESSTAPGP